MNVTMDRYEADWSIVERGWKAHVLGQGQTFSSAAEAVKQLSESNSDQYLDSFVVSDPNDTDQPLGAIEDGDAVLCANFRGDRVIEISRTFDEKEFDKFDRQRHPDVRYAGLMEYDGDLHIPKHYLVNPPLIERTAGEYLVNNNVSTYAVSETQKFGHVTYFWNGNKSGTFDDGLETYAEVESDRIQFNEAPAMKAKEISDLAVQALASGKYDCVRLNFANGDMVGHTGDLQASIEAMEVVDKYLGVVLEAVEEQEGSFVIVGDHGNADQMVQKKKGEALVDDQGNHLPLTSHTLAPVPFIVGGPGLPDKVTVRHDIENAGLANVTASYINMLGLESPVDYEESLLVFSEAQ